METAGKKKAKKKPGDDDPQFVQFYDAYPHKVARPKALQAWQKINPDAETFAQIMAGLERYKSTKPDWQHWAHPATWLNQGRWTDEPPAKPLSETFQPIPFFGAEPRKAPTTPHGRVRHHRSRPPK